MKTKIFTQENYKNDCSFVSTKLDKKGNPEKLYTDGTVLIPESLHDHFTKQSASMGKRKYINLLLKRYRSFLKLDSDDVATKLNTDYQVLNLGLHRENIHVEYKTWAELKMWKAFLNWSVCKIVSFLVHLDLAGIVEEVPVEFLSLVSPKVAKFFLKSRNVFSTRMSVFARRFKIHRFDYD